MMLSTNTVCNRAPTSKQSVANVPESVMKQASPTQIRLVDSPFVPKLS